MLRSMLAGVAGLKAHQTKMDVIGNNIANVNTYGYKSSRVVFRDMYYQTLKNGSAAIGNVGGTNSSQVGYGSTVGSIDLNYSRSGFASTDKATDCYIDGEGYFILRDSAGNERYTRVGQMDFDGDGNLVDPTGNYVCGYPAENINDQVTVGTSTINFGQDNGTVSGYTVEFKCNPASGAAPTTTVSSDKTKKTITITYTPKTTGDQLTAADLKTALQGTWSGDGDLGLNKSLFTVTGNIGSDATGLTKQITIGQPQIITNHFGQLINVAVTASGTITGQDTSGKIIIVGQLALANVPNPQALTSEGNCYFKANNNCGAITYSTPGTQNLGSIKANALETSNVDLSNEISDMIMTERGFQANSKIITVSDELLDTLVNLKR